MHRDKITYHQWRFIKVFLELASIQRSTHDYYLQISACLHNLQKVIHYIKKKRKKKEEEKTKPA